MDPAPLIGIALLTLLGVVLIALKNQILFKMGIRNLVRRPKRAAIVLAGVLISTAIISGSLVSSSSFNYAVVKATYDSLGNVDEIVTINGQPFSYENYNKLASNAEIKNNTDGLSPGLVGQAPSVDDVTSGITSTRVTLVGLNFSADAPFGQFTLSNGSQTNASDLKGAEVLINSKLAQDLNAHIGDRLTVYRGSSGSSLKAYAFTIKYIANGEGKALYGLNKNIFMTLDAAQTVFQAVGRINEIRVSNTGDAESGVTKSNDVAALINKSLSGSADQFNIRLVKQDMLKSASERGAQLSNLLIVLTAFSVITGSTLIVNVFLTFSEQRKSELGLARAVGLKRRHLVLLFLFEGATCALLAAPIGSLLGVGIVASIVNALDNAFVGETLTGPILTLHYSISDLLTAFLVGLAVALAAVAGSAYKIGKLTIVKAIYNVAEAEHAEMRQKTPVFGMLMLMSTLALCSTLHDPLATDVIIPTFVIVGLCFVACRFITSRLALSIAGVALTFYNGCFITLKTSAFSDAHAAIIFAASGMLLLVGVIMIVLINTPPILKGLAKLLGKFKASQASLTLSVAYSLKKRSGTGITITVLSLVIFLMIVGSVTAAIYQPDINKQMGGYDIRATSSRPLANLTILQVQSRTPEEPATRVALSNTSRIKFYDGLFATRATGLTVNDQSPSNQGSDPNAVYGIDANFTKHTTYHFKDALSYFSSPKAVWASLHNPHYAIVDASYSYGANGTEVRAGDIITMQTANKAARFVVAGVLDEFYLHGIFLSKQQVHRLFPAITGDTLFLIKSESGLKPIELSYDLKRDYKVAGIDAFLIRDELLQMTQQNQLLFQLVATYLGLGLVVGIASVGVTTLRSIRERRQEIGVMRAIGFTRGLIIQSLLLEAIFGTTLASIIGLSAGLTVSYAIYLSFGEAMKAAFAVPVITLLTIFSVVYLSTVICTVIPARDASRASPAEAIRYSE